MSVERLLDRRVVWREEMDAWPVDASRSGQKRWTEDTVIAWHSPACPAESAGKGLTRLPPELDQTITAVQTPWECSCVRWKNPGVVVQLVCANDPCRLRAKESEHG